MIAIHSFSSIGLPRQSKGSHQLRRLCSDEFGIKSVGCFKKPPFFGSNFPFFIHFSAQISSEKRIERIIQGRDVQKPLFELGNIVCVPNLNPSKPGHAIFFTKRDTAHCFNELTDNEWLDLKKAIALFQTLWESLPCNLGKTIGYTQWLNDNPISGQSIQRFHWHVCPSSNKNPIPVGSIKRALNPSVPNHPKDRNERRKRVSEIMKPFRGFKKFLDNSLNQVSLSFASSV